MAAPFVVVEREKASSRESHGHQELSRATKVITALFAPEKVKESLLRVLHTVPLTLLLK